MEIKKPENWMTAEEMLEKTLEVRASIITSRLGQIMLLLTEAAKDGELATTVNILEDTKIISQILEEAGYKVQFLKPNGEYSQYIISWDIVEEEIGGRELLSIRK